MTVTQYVILVHTTLSEIILSLLRMYGSKIAPPS